MEKKFCGKQLMKINKETKIILSASSKPGNFGATVYNEIFKIKKLNFIYLPVKFDEPKKLYEVIKSLNVKGCSISMPLKKKMINHIKLGDVNSKKSGSINTIVNRNSKFIGFNTDIYGSYEVFRKLKFKNALIFGSGGVTSSLIISLKDLQKKFQLVQEKKVSSKLIYNFNLNYNYKTKQHYDLIINATPVNDLDVILKFISQENLKNSKYFMNLSVSNQPLKIQKDLKNII